MRKAERCRTKITDSIIFLITVSLFFVSTLHAEVIGPLTQKGDKQCGINFGYGHSFESNSDLRFASIYPY